MYVYIYGQLRLGLVCDQEFSNQIFLGLFVDLGILYNMTLGKSCVGYMLVF